MKLSKWLTKKEIDYQNDMADSIISTKLSTDAIFYGKVLDHVKANLGTSLFSYSIDKANLLIVMKPVNSINNVRLSVFTGGTVVLPNTYFGVVVGEALSFFNSDISKGGGITQYVKIDLHSPSMIHNKFTYCFSVSLIKEIRFSLIRWVFKYGLQNAFTDFSRVQSKNMFDLFFDNEVDLVINANAIVEKLSCPIEYVPHNKGLAKIGANFVQPKTEQFRTSLGNYAHPKPIRIAGIIDYQEFDDYVLVKVEKGNVQCIRVDKKDIVSQSK